MKKRITSNHICHALANLALIGFGVADSCGLMCKYCEDGEFYNDYDIRIDNKKEDAPH